MSDGLKDALLSNWADKHFTQGNSETAQDLGFVSNIADLTSDQVNDTAFGAPLPITTVTASEPIARKLSDIQKENADLINEAINAAIANADSQNALKFDDNKIPVELLPTQPLEEIAKVLAFGAKKYDSWNWSKGFKWARLIGAAIRHLYAFQRGEDKDPESGLSHLAHAGCCILFLLQHEISGLGEDNRHKDFTKKDIK